MLNQREKPLEETVTPVKPRKTSAGSKASIEKAVKAESVAPVKKVATVRKTAVKKSVVAGPVKAMAADKAPQIAQLEIAQEEIAKLAYLLWESRGYLGGSPEEDWLKAEALLRSGSTAVS
jgi:Protein of unknown function (DUF2934)